MPRPASLLPYAAYGIALACFTLASAYSRYDFPLDDAWIHRVYAQSFAYGHGFQYNPGTQEAGATSPLWAIVTAPAHWLEPLGTPAVVLAVKAIAALLGGGVLHSIFGLGYAATGYRAAGVIAATLCAADPRFLFSVLSGMENVLLLAVWLESTRALVRGQRGRSLAWLSLAPVCRPEALVLLPLWLAGVWLAGRRQRPTMADHGGWLLAFTPAAAWSLFCHTANGHWLPTTFYLKARSFQLEWSDLQVAWDILSQHGYVQLHVFLFGMAVLVGWGIIRREFTSMALLWHLLAAPVLYALAVAGSRELSTEGYYWTRWLDPASLVLTAAWCLVAGGLLTGAGEALGGLLQRRTTPVPRWHWCLAALGLITACWLAVDAPRFVASFTNRRSQLASDARAIHLINVSAGEWIRDHTPASARVAVNDAGAIRYFGRRWTLDLVGLNNAQVAFGPRPTLDGMDWLAVFPALYAGATAFEFFAPRQVFAIPPAEYTICPCPGQTRLVIFERIRAPGS